jgi:chromosome segregation ATPase
MLIVPTQASANNEKSLQQDIAMLLSLLHELTQDFETLEKLSVSQSTDLTGLTNQLSELRERLRMREAELEQIEQLLSESQSASKLLKLQLQQAETYIEQLRNELNALEQLLNDIKNQASSLIDQVESLTRRARMQRILIIGAAITGVAFGWSIRSALAQ